MPERDVPTSDQGLSQKDESLLLHICCGPCATHVIDLLKTRYNLIGFFFNPNIQPASEYYKRLESARHVFELQRLPLWVPAYQPDIWTEGVRGLELEPEGGRRCQRCFRHRLLATAQAAKEAGLAVFATTLTISPHKNHYVINEIGTNIAVEHELSYLSSNFKKKNGFLSSIEKSRELGLYRQQTCGCPFGAKKP